MRRSLIAISGLLLTASFALAGEFHYETRQKQTGGLTDHSIISISREENGNYTYHFRRGLPDYVQEELHTFNAAHETIDTHVVNAQDGTDYTLKREGHTLIIKGKLKGRIADQTIRIGKEPFFSFPKFNLAAFILQRRKQVAFWALRTDTFKLYKMIAVKTGRKTIQLGGKDANALEIYMTTDNPLFRLFKRYYYFRPSDGMFLKQEYDDGRVRELAE